MVQNQKNIQVIVVCQNFFKKLKIKQNTYHRKLNFRTKEEKLDTKFEKI